jgi:uncharacterized protein (TIGR00730 family)
MKIYWLRQTLEGKRMTEAGKRITVFGASSPRPGDQAYQDAYRLGKLIGSSGYTVLTGGYMGTMEAVSRGAAESGGHVIGVTSDEIEAWRPTGPNRWIQEEWRFPTLRQRLYALIEACDVAIALPGGIGTLAEVSVMWSQMQVSTSPQPPLILVGAGWQATIEILFEQLDSYIPEKDRALIMFTPEVKTAFSMLQSSLTPLDSPLSTH